MENLEPKKLALLRILEIFKNYSDQIHPLKQEDIAKHLEREYGVDLERKAISRNISLLKEAGYEIESTREGSFLLEREFEDSELRMLIDGVLSSRYIAARHSKDLIEKLCGMSNKYFRSHVKNIYSVNEWTRTDNQALFYNIELIDDAIMRGKQIQFDYNKYGLDKKLHKSSTNQASPYQLILHNQRYYLMCRNEYWRNLGFYRVDHITNVVVTEEPVVPITNLEGYENGINYRELSTSLPYLYTDKIERIEFVAQKVIIDQIVDWFGTDITITELDDKQIQVSLKASPNAMEHWAMQYINYVEIIKPIKLRGKIKENIKTAGERYQ